MTDDKNRLLIHTITNARLIDVSFVKDPANPHAYIKYFAIPENFPVYPEAWKKANDVIVEEISKASLQAKQAQQEYETSRKKRKRDVKQGMKIHKAIVDEWLGE